MRANEKIICPVCGEPSVAKLTAKLDGFKKVGDLLTCLVCGAELGPVAAPDAEGAVQEDRKLHDLGLLLGAAPEARVRLTAAPAEQRFCKDCANFLEHPFVTRCALDNRPVEAMGDCPNYRKRA